MPSWTIPSLALSGLWSRSESPDARAAIEAVAAADFRAVQLDATMHGLRPRDLDSSARRGIVSLLKRLELSLSGLDLWIPPEHFTRPDTQQRALDAASAAIELAADLRSSGPLPTVSLHLPETDGDWRAHLGDTAARHGVRLANHASVEAPSAAGSPIGMGIDCAELIERNQDVPSAVARAGKDLFSVRLTDSTGRRRVALGSGKLDLFALGASLAVGHADVPAVVDVRDVESPLEAAIAARTLWPPL